MLIADAIEEMTNTSYGNNTTIGTGSPENTGKIVDNITVAGILVGGLLLLVSIVCATILLAQLRTQLRSQKKENECRDTGIKQQVIK